MSCTRSKKSPKRRPGAISKSREGGLRSSSSSGREPDRAPEIRHGSPRGVFFDICDTPEEAHNLTLRSELMVQISEIIQRRKLTQDKAAKFFGVTQPRISDLVRGRIDLFSLDTLVNMMTRAGLAVHLVVKQPAA
jgi:predicted XRE-type DNA-binding protein